MKAKLKVVTPLHIGSGERYSALEYLYENGILKKYSIEKVIQVAEEEGILNILADYFKRETSSGKPHSLREICDKEQDFKEVILKLKPEYKIHAEIGEEGKEIEEFIKSNGKIYIPGSEIKGSLRRALLFYVLMEDEKFLDKLIEKLKRAKGRKRIEKVAEEIENVVFRGERDNKPIRDAKEDVLKFLRVSDTNLITPSKENLKVKEIGVFYTNSGKRRNSFFSEVVLAGTEFKFDINVSLKALKKFIENSSCHETIKEIFMQAKDEKSIVEEIFRIWREAEKKCLEIDQEHIPVSENGTLESTVRLGKHEGYLFTTVMALVKERSEKVFKDVFKASVPRFSEIPNKTRKLTAKERLPLGFCTVEIV
jgi:CRISPR-associated protein Csm5